MLVWKMNDKRNGCVRACDGVVDVNQYLVDMSECANNYCQ